MIIGKLFNILTLTEYFFYIDNHKQYTDFNTLGLYRSITKNEKLDLSQKLELRDYAHQFFQKTFDFLQIKEPQTYFELITLGQKLTHGDINQIWNEIKQNQQKILLDKRIKHRNFGVFSKQTDFGGYLPRQDRIMLKQKNTIESHSNSTPFWTTPMQFKTDKSKTIGRIKSENSKMERKNHGKYIKNSLDSA